MRFRFDDVNHLPPSRARERRGRDVDGNRDGQEESMTERESDRKERAPVGEADRCWHVEPRGGATI